MSASAPTDHRRTRRDRLRVVGHDAAPVRPPKPDGTPRKLMDSSRLAAMRWEPKTGLEDRFRLASAWFLANERRSGGVLTPDRGASRDDPRFGRGAGGPALA